MLESKEGYGSCRNLKIRAFASYFQIIGSEIYSEVALKNEFRVILKNISFLDHYHSF